MKRVTIFGKPGGGKTSLAIRLSKSNGLSHYPLDSIEYRDNGERVSREEYMVAHEEFLSRDGWIIDGLGVLEAFWQRIEMADTVVFVDLPYWVSYWWVTKRFLMSVFRHPEGWPKGCSVFKGTVASWKYLGLSRKFWTEDLLEKIKQKSKGKDFIHVTQVRQLNQLYGRM